MGACALCARSSSLRRWTLSRSMHPYATSVCVAGLKNAWRCLLLRRSSSFYASVCASSSSSSSSSTGRPCARARKTEMCDAWLLLTRHGPDGARAHTGYAYGSMARACNPEGRSNPTPRALLLQPPEERRNAPRSEAVPLGSRTYAHAESAHEVTRPQVFIRHSARSTHPPLLLLRTCALVCLRNEKSNGASRRGPLRQRSTKAGSVNLCV